MTSTRASEMDSHVGLDELLSVTDLAIRMMGVSTASDMRFSEKKFACKTGTITGSFLLPHSIRSLLAPSAPMR